MTRLALLSLVAAALLAPNAYADSSFSETESPDDGLFHIDVGVSFLQAGQPPRDNNFGVGTIKISLPGGKARFDPALAIDQASYTCSVTASAYGEAGAGYICSTDGQPQGTGLAFPNAVTVHLLSQDCYAPPPQGSSQPAVAEVWAAPGDPGTPPDGSFPIVADVPCNDGADEPPVDTIAPLKCVVPKLKNVPLKKVAKKLKNAGCKRGKVRYSYSRSLKKGRVLKQLAKARRKLKLNAKINLVVSKGPKPRAR